MRVIHALALCVLAACSGQSALPPAEIVDLAGLEARVAQNKGRPLLLNFWAMW